MGEEPPERPVALAATDRPLPVRVAAIEDDRAPDGMACLGSFLGPRLLARCVLPPDAAALLLERGLFAQPVRLALVELPDDFFTKDEDEEDTPWADSVPGAAYDRAVEDGPADPEEPEEDDRQAAVFLGQIIRFEKDRKHPRDLGLETMDVLRTIVQGDVSEVVDKVLEDLLGGSGPQ